MADIKISALTDGGEALATDDVLVVRAGANRRVRPPVPFGPYATLAALIAAKPPTTALTGRLGYYGSAAPFSFARCDGASWVDGGGNFQPVGGLAGLGDSITANGHSGVANLASGVIGPLGPRNWLMWASLLSGGRLPYVGIAATGGFTTQKIIDTHLPTMVDAVRSGRVSTVTVLCGTNDIGAGVSLGVITANLTTIYNALSAVGARVVACMLTPRESAPGVPDITASRAALSRLNAWISRQRGVLVCDLHTPCVTAGGIWVSGLNWDNVHPNSAGAKIMGQALAETLIASTPVVNAPWLAATSESTGSAGYSAIGNPLMADTDADGKPDGVATGGAIATTNATGAGLRGNYSRIAATSASTAFANYGNAVFAAQGNQILMTARVRSTVEATPGANCDIAIVSKPSEAVILCSLVGWDRDIPDGSVLSVIATTPSLGAETICGLQTKVRGAAGAYIELAQVTMFNLTAATA